MADRRAYGIYLTPKGESEYDNIQEFFSELEAILSSNLTSDEKMTLLKLLEKVCMHPQMQ